MTVRVGIIGSGFARAAYLPALRHVPGARVVAIASARLERARAAAHAFDVPHASDDWRALLRDHELDLVCIATPPDLHAPMTLAALDAGAHVLCEKPTAMSATEAEAMRARAAERGRIGLIGHELRFDPNRRRVAAWVAAGEIGEVLHAHVTHATPGWAARDGRRRGDWKALAARGGGLLGAHGSHQVDLLRWWFGPVVATFARLETLTPDRVDPDTGMPWTATADDFVHLLTGHDRCRHADVRLSAVAPVAHENATVVHGREGTLLLRHDDETLHVARAGGAFADVTLRDPHADLPGIGPGVWNVATVGLLRELCAAIRERRAPSAGATFEDGWRNQRVLDAAREAHAERRWVPVDA
jgi:predicted dehydrogenase